MVQGCCRKAFLFARLFCARAGINLFTVMIISDGSKVLNEDWRGVSCLNLARYARCEELVHILEAIPKRDPQRDLERKRLGNINIICKAKPDLGIRQLFLHRILIYNIAEFRGNVPHFLQEHRDIMWFMQQLKESKEERATMKLVVLGNGRIGKSTLVNYLRFCSASSVKVCRNLTAMK